MRPKLQEEIVAQFANFQLEIETSLRVVNNFCKAEQSTRNYQQPLLSQQEQQQMELPFSEQFVSGCFLDPQFELFAG